MALVVSEGQIGRAYMWPPRCRISFYNGRNKLLWSSSRRNLDLSDTLMLDWPHASRRVTLGMSSQSRAACWHAWTEENVANLEYVIRHDLTYDGYRLGLVRLTNVGIPCSDEFRWALRIVDPIPEVHAFRVMAMNDRDERLRTNSG